MVLAMKCFGMGHNMKEIMLMGVDMGKENLPLKLIKLWLCLMVNFGKEK